MQYIHIFNVCYIVKAVLLMGANCVTLTGVMYHISLGVDKECDSLFYKLIASLLPSVMVYKEWMADCITVGWLTLRKEVLAVYRTLKIIQPSKLYSALILLLNHFAHLQKLIF